MPIAQGWGPSPSVIISHQCPLFVAQTAAYRPYLFWGNFGKLRTLPRSLRTPFTAPSVHCDSPLGSRVVAKLSTKHVLVGVRLARVKEWRKILPATWASQKMMRIKNWRVIISSVLSQQLRVKSPSSWEHHGDPTPVAIRAKSEAYMQACQSCCAPIGHLS